MLSEIGFTHDEAKNIVDRFSIRMNHAINKIDFDSEVITAEFEDFSAISDGSKIAELIDKFSDLTQIKQAIFAKMDKLLESINALLVNKYMSFAVDNRPRFTRNNQEISYSQLSSGKKQMFILLGEMYLLDYDRPVLVADEPEISLHLDWQVKIVGLLKNISPDSQIILATHSPDIIGFDEELVKLVV